MKIDKVIFKKLGRTKKSIIKRGLITSLIIGTILYLTTSMSYIAIFAFSLSFLIEVLLPGPYGTFSLYDGWTIEDNSIILYRTNLLSSKRTELSFVNINKMEVSKFGRPKYISFNTKEGKYRLSIKDIFYFADTLKFLKQKNIPVNFSQRDAEIELYLSGRIDKIPMTNDEK